MDMAGVGPEQALEIPMKSLKNTGKNTLF